MAAREDARVAFVAHGGQRDVVRARVHAFRHFRGGIEHLQIGADVEAFDCGFHGVADALVLLRHQNVDRGDVVRAEVGAHLLSLFKIVGVQSVQILIAVLERADRPAQHGIGVRAVLGDGLRIDGVPRHFTDLLVREGAVPIVVERQQHLVEADAADRRDAVGLAESVGG